MIRQINKDELPLCLDFIHLCFSTVAEKFGFTKENAPGHNAFMPMEKLENFWNWGFLMYGLFNGFEFKGTVKYEHLPFTVGYAECFLGE